MIRSTKDVPEVVKEVMFVIDFVRDMVSGRLKAADTVRHDTYDIMLSVSGVTFDGRQDILAGLKGDELCELVHNPVDGHPYAIEVHMGGQMIGYLPDEHMTSMAKMLYERAKSGKEVYVAQWNRVGGYSGLKYGIRLLIRIQK
jgi:hypothetical protein